MTDDELRRLAGVLWESAPRARMFNNKQVLWLVTAAIIFAGGFGVMGNKILSFPLGLDEERWQAAYSYAVTEQPAREKRYDLIIQGFAMADARHDRERAALDERHRQRMKYLEERHLALEGEVHQHQRRGKHEN